MEFINKHWVKIVIALIALIIVLFIYRHFKKPANAEYLEGGGNVNQFNPEIYTDELFNVIDGLFTLADTKNEAAKKVGLLNDNQIISIYNDWLKRYYQKNKETLTQAMLNEVNKPYLIWGGSNYWNDLISRLKRLKLN